MAYSLEQLAAAIHQGVGGCDQNIPVPSPLAPGELNYEVCGVGSDQITLHIYRSHAETELARGSVSPYVVWVFGPNWSVESSSERTALDLQAVLGGTVLLKGRNPTLVEHDGCPFAGAPGFRFPGTLIVWPDGWAFDETTGAVRDSSGKEVARVGEKLPGIGGGDVGTSLAERKFIG